MNRSFVLFFAVLFGLITSAPANAKMTVLTWNVDGGQKTAATLKNNAAAMAADVGQADIVILQEIISEEQVSAIAEGLGLEHWAISNLAPPVSITGHWARSLELAVVSRIPILAAAEWDTTGRQHTGDGYVPLTSNQEITGTELDIDVAFDQARPSRGFLRIDLQGGFSVYAVHWKSSRGESCNAADIGFARKRENQAAGIFVDASKMLSGGRTVIVGGDFNIQAPGKVLRSGFNAGEDCQPTNGNCAQVCGATKKDGYDDSIQTLLSLGNGARLLSKDVGFTYVDGPFSNAAIDHLFVAGRAAATFTNAKTPAVSGNRYKGSDHRPVFAESTATIPAAMAFRAQPIELQSARSTEAEPQSEEPAQSDVIRANRSLHWIRRSAEYAVITRQFYQSAYSRLKHILKRQRSQGPWVVVIDADETILDNSQEAVERLERNPGKTLANVGFDEDAWDNWVKREEAGAVPGAVEFLHKVAALGGRIAVVTNRKGQLDHHTRNNLRKIGLDLPADVMCVLGRTEFDKKKTNPDEWTEFDYRNDKDRRRRLLSIGGAGSCWERLNAAGSRDTAQKAWSKPHTLLMFIGDNIKDLPRTTSAVADNPALVRAIARNKQYLILPNPVYGSGFQNRDADRP